MRSNTLDGNRPDVDVSVAICTWNRSKLLSQTLLQMQKLRVPAGMRWELLVINNNCSDDTDEVVAQSAGELPVRVIHESTPGLSNARNRAVDEARAKWLMFTDDDVLVDEGWLTEYFVTIQEVGENVAFLGGEVRPWFEEEPNAELCVAIPTVANGFCGVTVPDKAEIVDQKDRQPMGANFAVRRTVPEGIRFDPNFGPTGLKRVLNDERDLIHRLLAQGFSGKWVAGAGVRHFVPKERMQLISLRRHLFGLGQTSVKARGRPAGRAAFGVPLWAVREVVQSAICMPVNFVLQRRVAFYRDFSRLCTRCGIVWACLQERRGYDR